MYVFPQKQGSINIMINRARPKFYIQTAVHLTWYLLLTIVYEIEEYIQLTFGWAGQQW